MVLKYTITVKCPYCGNEFVQVFEVTIYDKNDPPTLSIGTQNHRVILCDTFDTPGCDRYFVAQPIIKVATESWAIDF